MSSKDGLLEQYEYVIRSDVYKYKRVSTTRSEGTDLKKTTGMMHLWISIFLLTVATAEAEAPQGQNCCVRADNGKHICYSKPFDGTPSSPVCEDPASCSADPCEGKSCPACPDAICVSKYCWGCSADFYIQVRNQGWVKIDCNGGTSSEVFVAEVNVFSP